MNRIKTAIVLVMMICSMTIFASSSPIPMLKSTSDNIINTLEVNKAALAGNPQIIYSAVKKFLLPQVDVMGMSRSVLGRSAWNKASKSERNAFAKSFTDLVIRTYASPLAQYSNETVKFLPIRGTVDKRFIRVNSVIIRSNGKNIPLSYSLVSKKGQWKIYDLSVEGVSLLQSFRSQFAQVLQNSDMQSLLSQMKKKR